MAITGIPAANASTKALPNPSMTEGRTKISETLKYIGRLLCSICPRNLTRSSTPMSLAIILSFSRSSPSPAMINFTFVDKNESARITSSTPRESTRREAVNRNTSPACLSSASFRNNSAFSGIGPENFLVSTAFGITTTGPSYPISRARSLMELEMTLIMSAFR